VIAGYQSDRLAEIHTTEAAWRTFVGSSTPQEFLMYSQEKNARDAVSAYVGELPGAMGHEYNEEEIQAITGMLFAYICQSHSPKQRGRR
jgi:hypothetical protein